MKNFIKVTGGSLFMGMGAFIGGNLFVLMYETITGESISTK